jgi:hypothetical protein
MIDRTSAPPTVARPHAPHRRPTGAPAATACDCRYCGAVLPRGRAVTFCPYCGQDVTVQQCPACSTELDVAWRFCVACGRGVT